MRKPGIGHNNPPPDDAPGPQFHPRYWATARPAMLRRMLDDVGAAKLGPVVTRIMDAMTGPGIAADEAGGLLRLLVTQTRKPGDAADERRRELQRKRQVTPEYRARKREREAGYRAGSRGYRR